MEPLRPPLIKRLTTAHWIAIDCVAAALVVAGSTLLTRGSGSAAGAGWANLAVVVLAVLGAALRRSWPRAALAVVAVPLAAGFSTFPAPWLAVAFVMYMIPLRFPRREALWLLAGTLLVAVVGVAGLAYSPPGPPGPNRVATLLASALLITVGWTIGYAVRQQRMYAAGLHERAEQRAHEQVAEARRAMSEERLRIARELHDVVAHTMSVIAVQAGVANHVAAERPEEARRALSSIEETSRGALHEMRAMLGVLREEGTPAEPGLHGAGPTPAPSLADLGTLVDRAAEAGVRVDLSVDAERPELFPSPELSPGLELAAYRVVQEAITNVIKHAGTDRCRVSVACRPDALAVEVTDDGNGAAGSTDGHGIAGMRERVGMYGGEFRAGPLPGHGFQVTARFPVTTPVVP